MDISVTSNKIEVILNQKDAQVHACLTAQTFQSGDTGQNISSESRNINQGIWMSLVKHIFFKQTCKPLSTANVEEVIYDK
jgi:hypothetical protein